MDRKRVTMADVARLAGVSRTAVSLILNDRVGTRLSPDAVERVRRAAEELGYRPNLTARALSTRRSHAIGFVSDRTATERYASALIHGALVEARARGYVLFIAETEGEPDAERQAFDALVDRQVDGLIFATSWSRKLELPEPPAHTRLVLLNAVSDHVPTAVLPDEERGAREVVDLLLAACHRDDIVVSHLPERPTRLRRLPSSQRVRDDRPRRHQRGVLRRRRDRPIPTPTANNRGAALRRDGHSRRTAPARPRRWGTRVPRRNADPHPRIHTIRGYRQHHIRMTALLTRPSSQPSAHNVRAAAARPVHARVPDSAIPHARVSDFVSALLADSCG